MSFFHTDLPIEKDMPVTAVLTEYICVSSVWDDHHYRPGDSVRDDRHVRRPIRDGSWDLSPHHHSGK